MPTWPSSLPTYALQDGFQSAREDNRIAFQPEVGPPLRRRRHRAVSHIHQMQIILTNTQRETLEDFYNDDLEGGVLPFTHPEDPVLGAAADFTFESIITYTPHGFRDDERCWRAAFVLRRMPE